MTAFNAPFAEAAAKEDSQPELNRPLSKTAAVIRHVHFEDLGTLKDVLDAQNYAITYYEAGIDDIASLRKTSPDLLVVLGAPIGANDEQKYPFLKDTLALLKERIAADAPTLGICLGAQLVARAIGAKVYKAPVKQIGWSTLYLTKEGAASPLLHFERAGGNVLHWHGDTFDVPKGAELLAFTLENTNQAFRYGKNILAFQFHPELQAANFERWLIGHACEIEQTPGINVGTLREDTKRYGASLERAARKTFNEWVGTLPLSIGHP